MTAMEQNTKDFESAIGELESIVKTLEGGDLSLEQSLELYERGVQLSRFCHTRLEDAERRIEVLNDRGERAPAPDTLTRSVEDGDDEGPTTRNLSTTCAFGVPRSRPRWKQGCPRPPRAPPSSPTPCGTACWLAASVCAPS